VHETDEIDRSLSTDESIRASSRLLPNVMAGVRAIARPAPPTFPWHEFSFTLASHSSFAAAAGILCIYIDPTVFVPVARELMVAGATIGGALATIYRGHHSE
jgi:hypothetical protein